MKSVLQNGVVVWYLHIPPGPPDPLLKLLTFPASVLMEFLEVFNPLLRRTKLALLPFLSFTQKLFCGDLETGINRLGYRLPLSGNTPT
jgi:hypothetical protein